MNKSLLGIIPAAGSGVRARPYSYEMHKGMFAIDGKPNLVRIIESMRDDFDISEIVIILGYMGNSVKESLGDGDAFNVKINYVENQHLDKGWAWSVLLAKPFLGGRDACIMLSDEFYLDSNHKTFAETGLDGYIAKVAYQQTEDPELIKRNFSIEQSGDRAIRLTENPLNITNNLLGLANFVVAPELFERLEKAYDSGRPSIEFVNFVDELIRDGEMVGLFELSGHYINLNDVASLEAASDLAIRHRLEGEA